MFIRRLVIGALMAAARNPAVQKKAGEVANLSLIHISEPTRP